MQITRPLFDEDEIRSLHRCLDSGWVTQGPLTGEFERSVAQRHRVKHALATTSCTSALHLAAIALDLKAGDEVIVPAFTWITSANCAEYVGARPVFVDVDAATFNLDPRQIEAAIGPRTRAIVAVHLFGLPAPMKPILEIARPRRISVIEDAACAIGSSYAGQPVGGLGDLGCFSFHPRKIVTTGEGGMVTTNDDALAARIASFRNHGATGLRQAERDNPRPYSMATFDNLGYNLRLSDIQAAVGIAQMNKLDRLLAERRAKALRYLRLLAGVGDVVSPAAGEQGHTYQSFVILVREGGRTRRNRIMDHMQQLDIQTRPGTHAVHRLGYYAVKYGLRPEQFPVASLCEDTSITLPLFPGMTDAEQDLVVESLVEGLRL